MYNLKLSEMTVTTDFQKGHIQSLVIDGKERSIDKIPLFKIGLRDKDGDLNVVSAYDAFGCECTTDGALYEGFNFEDGKKMTVHVCLKEQDNEAVWNIIVNPNNENVAVEYVDFPLISLPKLRDNNEKGDGGEILIPYNEGAIVSDITRRSDTPFKYWEPTYPSQGSYSMFPNMLSSQMIAYLWEDCGLYVGVHDADRGLKQIDFYEENDGVVLKIRLYCGGDFGEEYNPDFPIVWSVTDGNWQSSAEKYRNWFSKNLPTKVVKASENKKLPEWYKDLPLIVAYPVRGVHDTDEMKPNALYPYTNALPILKEIKSKTKSRIMALLMHWEGTAPWAPPYVWPPYGDENNFNEFTDQLHKDGDLIGLYCSGFGYTIQSNLVSNYNMQKEYDEKELWKGMCAGPDGKVEISNICTAQRSGYDICPASEKGKRILDEAYRPLFESSVDYVQILDQNHGGGQYFCYSKEHGHPPVPGKWMTENMQNLLSDWNKKCPDKLLGCESAASEAFIGNLAFSDNRFEINYFIGKPVPLYAYLYHEYIRNFMGNQVVGYLASEDDTLRYRLAYSFAAGDVMTVVLNPNGDFLSYWGMTDFSKLPDKEKVLKFIGNMTKFYNEQAKEYLFAGKMIKSPDVKCNEITYYLKRISGTRPVVLPEILCSAWESEDGKKAVIMVNPHDEEKECTVNGKKITISPMDAKKLDM